MTKQITAAEKRETFSKDLKPVRLQSTTLPALPSDGNMEASIATPTEVSQASSRPSSVQGLLRCKWELLTVIIKELLPVIQQHYKAVGLNGVAFDPNWDHLFALERARCLLMWIARTADGAIVGYAQVTQSAEIFSQSTRLCVIDSVWLDPAWREGWKGIKFIRSLVNAIKDLKASDRIRIFSNDDYDIGSDGRSRVARAFEAAGFRQVGTMFEIDLNG